MRYNARTGGHSFSHCRHYILADPSFKVFITDVVWPTLAEELAVLEPAGACLEYVPGYSHATLLECVSQADAILTCWHQVPEDALRVAERCRIVGRYGIGLDNIPVDLATELGMLVANVPDFCLDELTDQVMAYILTAARQIPHLDAQVKVGRWARDVPFPIHRLRGRTLGLIGFGQTARVLVPKARAFGLQMLVYTPRLRRHETPSTVAVADSLTDLLSRSDFVSLHVPLTDETQGLMDRDAFRTMKNGAVLINTSRGAVVDEAALTWALERGEIGGACLDVRTLEPPDQVAPFAGHPNVLLTPHSAFYSEESIQELARKAARNVACALRGEVPPYLVNPEVLDQPNCRLLP